jgi:hypothetical protein
MPVGQGPEPWAAAMILAACAALYEARSALFILHAPFSAAPFEGQSNRATENGERRMKNGTPFRFVPWVWAVAAGLAGGAAELFRSGNWLLFVIPLVVFGFELCRTGRRGWTLPLVSLTSYFCMAFLAGQIVPSPVAKTVVNLSHNLIEAKGPFIPKPGSDDAYVTLGGFHIVPGTAETYYDYLVRASHDASLASFLGEHGAEIACKYAERLWLVTSSGAAGLRDIASTPVVLLFVLQLLTCYWDRRRRVVSVALGGAALAQYLGPITLLGADVCVYMLVPLPLMVIVAAAGAIRFSEIVLNHRGTETRRDSSSSSLRLCASVVPSFLTPRFTAALVLIPLGCLAFRFYSSTWAIARSYAEQARVEQASLDALQLDGLRVVTHTARWSADRDVELVMMPYGTVEEIARYVRARQADGILLWANDPDGSGEVNAYVSLNDLCRSLKTSPSFAPPTISGGWRWYRVRNY